MKIFQRLLFIAFAQMLLLLFVSQSYGQQELHIHHINVENGDATMVGVFDVGQGRYLSKVLIDGGMSTSGTYLVPYIHKVCGAGDEGSHFNYVILTHYHTDHYIGLNALKSGAITADSLVDPGGYDFSMFFPAQPVLGQRAEAPPAKLVVASQWTDLLAKAMGHQPAFIKGHSEALFSFGTGANSCLGHKLIIGQVGALPVTLECVAGWGNTLNGNGITADPLPDKDNPNNFTLAFVLQCGEFRYFIGGDLGGSDNGLYIDQETSLTQFFVHEYPVSHSMLRVLSSAGHICGFKADHHGSNNSNTTTFMKGMTPAVTVTSGGNKTGWFLPQEGYIGKLASVTALSVWTQAQAGTFNRGVYFTNLYDWGAGHNSLSKAKSVFTNHKGVNFDYGNDSGGKAGYLIRVQADSLEARSWFEVDRVDVSGGQLYTKLGKFFCHQK